MTWSLSSSTKPGPGGAALGGAVGAAVGLDLHGARAAASRRPPRRCRCRRRAGRRRRCRCRSRGCSRPRPTTSTRRPRRRRSRRRAGPTTSATTAMTGHAQPGEPRGVRPRRGVQRLVRLRGRAVRRLVAVARLRLGGVRRRRLLAVGLRPRAGLLRGLRAAGPWAARAPGGAAAAAGSDEPPVSGWVSSSSRSGVGVPVSSVPSGGCGDAGSDPGCCSGRSASSSYWLTVPIVTHGPTMETGPGCDGLGGARACLETVRGSSRRA